MSTFSVASVGKESEAPPVNFDSKNGTQETQKDDSSPKKVELEEERDEGQFKSMKITKSIKNRHQGLMAVIKKEIAIN